MDTGMVYMHARIKEEEECTCIYGADCMRFDLRQ